MPGHTKLTAPETPAEVRLDLPEAEPLLSTGLSILGLILTGCPCDSPGAGDEGREEGPCR